SQIICERGAEGDFAFVNPELLADELLYLLDHIFLAGSHVRRCLQRCPGDRVVYSAQANWRKGRISSSRNRFCECRNRMAILTAARRRGQRPGGPVSRTLCSDCFPGRTPTKA